MTRKLASLLLLGFALGTSFLAAQWPSPTQPEVWFKADSLSLSTGDRVYTWPDSSGNGRHATHTPGVPTFQRDVINGRPALRFTDNLLKIPQFGEYKTLFMVYRMNRTDREQVLLWHPLSNSDSTFTGGVISGQHAMVNTGFPSARRSDAYHPQAGSQFELLSSVATPTVTLVYLNRQIRDNITESVTGPSTASNLILGIRSDGVGFASHIATFAHFDLAELIIYRDALTPAERQQVENYLHEKYWQAGPTFSERVRMAGRGDIINIPNLNSALLPHVPITIQPSPESPQLVFSDMPEYFRTGDGIAMQEVVQPGPVRLYTYHVPSANLGNRVVTSVIENLGQGPLTLRFSRYAFPLPSGHYLNVGKQGLQSFFGGSSMPPPRQLAPGAVMPVDPAMDTRLVIDPVLVHGFYDFEIDQPARITVLQRPPSMTNAQALASLPRLPRILPGHHASGAGRGLFLDSNLDVRNSPGTRVDTAGGNRRLVIADGSRDPWVQGWDSISGITAPNKGNYGVVYRIRLERSSSDGRALALLMHNLYSADSFCKPQSGAVVVSRGVHPGGLVSIPGHQVFFSEAGDNVLLQVFPPLEPGAVETIEILYSPPGASCLPTPMLLMPIDFPRAEAATFDGWRHRANFSATELADPARTGWNSDPDGGGISLGLRYAFGLDPRQPDRRGLPSAGVSSFQVGGQSSEYLTLTYRRPKTSWDLRYIVEASTDLATWTPAETAPVAVTDAGDGIEAVTLRETVPVSSRERRFLRVRVERG